MISAELARRFVEMRASDRREAAAVARELLHAAHGPGLGSPHDDVPPEDVVIQATRSLSEDSPLRAGLLEACTSLGLEAIAALNRASAGDSLTDVENRAIERICRIIELGEFSELHGIAAALMAIAVRSPERLKLLAWSVFSAYQAYPQSELDRPYWTALEKLELFRRFAQRQLRRIDAGRRSVDVQMNALRLSLGSVIQPGLVRTAVVYAARSPDDVDATYLNGAWSSANSMYSTSAGCIRVDCTQDENPFRAKPLPVERYVRPEAA